MCLEAEVLQHCDRYCPSAIALIMTRYGCAASIPCSPSCRSARDASQNLEFVWQASASQPWLASFTGACTAALEPVNHRHHHCHPFLAAHRSVLHTAFAALQASSRAMALQAASTSTWATTAPPPYRFVLITATLLTFVCCKFDSGIALGIQRAIVASASTN